MAWPWPLSRRAEPDPALEDPAASGIPGMVDATTLRLEEVLASSRRTAVDAAATAAVQIAASIYEGALVAATIEAEGIAFPATLRGMIGRELVLRGEFVALLDLDPVSMQLDLLPCSSWDITGRTRPETWRYRADVSGPTTRTFTRRVDGAGVVHFRLNVRSAEPWRGRPGWAVAPQTSRLAGAIERGLVDEALIPVGRLFPAPLSGGQLTEYRDRLKRGGVVPISAAQTPSAHVHGPEPSNRWAPQTYGPAPGAPWIALREQVHRDVLSACGIPAEMVYGAAGSNLREVLRRFRVVTLEALGDRIREELVEKLERPVSISWAQTEPPDSLHQRSRVVRELMAAGIDADRALELAGIEG